MADEPIADVVARVLARAMQIAEFWDIPEVDGLAGDAVTLAREAARLRAGIGAMADYLEPEPVLGWVVDKLRALLAPTTEDPSAG